ncbi:hypothetical protein ACFYY1_35420 [Streptomyces sp. NPDC001890]|uniref:IS1096 element passenger TnpR family protein n=1 Tax=Streptomyces sp. NPDC001890 TaxID=3364620 RepID=UPI0036B0F748
MTQHSNTTHQQQIAKALHAETACGYQEALRRVRLAAEQGLLPRPLDRAGRQKAVEVLASALDSPTPVPAPAGQILPEHDGQEPAALCAGYPPEHDAEILTVLLAQGQQPEPGRPGPAPEIGWGQAVMAVGRSWQNLSSGERENLARRGLDAQPAMEWLALFECLSGWTSAHGQTVPRSAVHDGQPVGDWLWKQWHAHHGYRPGEMFLQLALAEVTGVYPYQELMPYVPPSLPYRASYDRARKEPSLDVLLQRDEELCRSTRGRAVHRAGSPDPGRGLVLMVSGESPSPSPITFTLACHASHTWIHLAEAIDRVFARDDDHLAAFFIQSLTWDLPPGDGGFYCGSSFERITIDRPRPEPAAMPFSPGEIPTQQTALAAMLAPGFKLGYLFDFGDKWMHRLRVLRWTHPQEDAQIEESGSPLVGIRPLDGPPGQYYPEDAPGWEHYLSLPSLTQARPTRSRRRPHGR